ncbi:MAG: R3H domain-containing nucleic acid-binding protein [Acidimicrobiia bacterium]
MVNVDMVEVKAKTVEIAVEAAMQELGIEDREGLDVEIVTAPVKGFLGIGAEDAVVRVTKRKSRRRRGGRRNTSSQGQGDQFGKAKSTNQQRGSAKSGKNGSRHRQDKPPKNTGAARKPERKEKTVSDDRPVLSTEEQARIAQEFLEGLVGAYGLEGEVTTTVDDDVIIADVRGEQTEALVGVRGTVRGAIHELTRTVLQRYGQETARLRLDIAGYAERRRQALSIYAEQLIDQLDTEGGEIMLEPMSPADRKVIHDVASARPGIESYSEGESPRRFVVLSKVSSSEEE